MTATAVQATQPKAAVKKPERFLKILVYGVSGSGKTRLAMSSLDVESMRRVLVLDVERGLIGIDPSPHWDSVAVNSLNDAESAVDRISQYKTVVIDSVTRLSRMSTTSFANSRTGGRPNDEVRQEDYGKTLRRVGAMLDYLQRAPINLIVIAGMKFVYAADSTPGNPKYKEILPDLDGKLLSRAQETADMVWPLLEQSGHTGLLTLNKEPYRVKSRRLLAMGEGKPVNQAGVVVDATMDKIWQAFQDSFTTPQ